MPSGTIGPEHRINGKFAPGNPGGGRPPKPNFRTLLESLPDEIKDVLLRWYPNKDSAENGVKITPDQMYVAALLCSVQSGDTQAIKEMGDRLFGKAPQAIDLNNDQGMQEEMALGVVAVVREAIEAGKGDPLAKLAAKLLPGNDADKPGGNGKGSQSG